MNTPPCNSRALLRLAVLLAFSALLCTTQHTNAKGIHVTVEASWNETSFLQEGCEWAGRTFGPTAFYSCVNALWDYHLRRGNDPVDGNSAASHEAVSARYSTQEVQYTAIWELARTLTETQMADTALFAVEMSSRVYSPAVEAHYATATQTLSAISASEQGDIAAASASPPRSTGPCGEPFGVLYTPALSASGQMQAQPVHSAVELKALLTALEQHQGTADSSSPSSRVPVVSVRDVSLTRLDYRYPSRAPQSEVSAVLVLYGLLGSSATKELHEAAVEWMEKGEGTVRPTSDAATTPTLAYFFRHLPVSRTRLCGPTAAEQVHESKDHAALVEEQWDTPLVVQGYGVTVDFKNMEYKVLDEKATAQQRAKAEAEGNDAAASSPAETLLAPADQADRVVAGFHMRRLTERYPHLALSLKELATLVEDEMGGRDLKVDFDVWELQNIGLAATQYIREVENSSRRLHVLKDVVNRFPLYAAALSRIAAQPNRLEVVQKALAGVRQRLSPGVSALFVEGWRVEAKDLSLFGVLDALKSNEAVSHHIKRALTTRLVPPGEEENNAVAARNVATVKVAPTLLEKVSNYVKRAAWRAAEEHGAGATSDAAFAIPDQYVTWLNDVEAEERFEGMPRQLKTFFTQASGVTPFPRRNLLHFVFIWNALRRSHLQRISMIYNLNRQGLLARYGLLLLDPEWSPEVASETTTATGAAGQAAGFAGQSSLSPEVLAISALAYHLAQAGQPQALIEVIVQLLQAHAAEDAISEDLISSNTVQQVCRGVADAVFGSSLEELMSNVDFVNHYHETQAMLRRFPMAEYPAALINGVVLDSYGGALPAALHKEVLQLREWVANGDLTDDMEDLYTQILQLRGAADHLQPALLRPPQTMPWTSTQAVVAFIEDAPYLYSAAYAFDVPSLTQILTLPCHATESTLHQLQTVLSALQSCADVTSERDAHYAVCRSLRVSIVSCPAAIATTTAADISPSSSDVSRYIAALLRQTVQRDVAEAKRLITIQRYVSHLRKALAMSPTVGGTQRRAGVLDRATVTAALAHDPLPDDLQVKETGTPADVLQRVSGSRDFWAALGAAMPARDVNVTLVTNGRLIAMDDTFTAWDVLEAARQMLPMTKAIEEAVVKVNFAEMTSVDADGAQFTSDEMDNAFYGGKIACLTSVFEHEKMAHEAVKSASPLVREEHLFASAEDRKRLRAVLFSVNNTPNGAASTGDGEELHRITAVVDPSSRDAQLIVSLVSYLMESPLRLRLTVLLNPSLDVKFPIRDFYEYVASARVNFDASSGRVMAPAATFTQLPARALLTLGVEEPPTWTVFSQAAEEDLDNILLSQLSPGTPFVFAVYRMHSILVTGDATDVLVGRPPDGLPLSLTTANARSTDTQVMANQNGYYQLQAGPGLWYLSVKPGPVAAAYCIEAIGPHPIPACAEGRGEINFTQGQHIPVVLDSFSGRYLSLRVRHTPTSSLPTSATGDGSGRDLHAILQKMASDVTHTWPPPWRARVARPHPPAKPTLHVFSVASGHLYERFLRMMFYSVHRTSSDKYGANTTRIKFWVIENFLSPQFKRYIPLLAAELGFEVGFVTYRWPWWLPRQTEKQRKIWAYKILFLDVIFPLDVDRVIFVDADQTAQADLHELYNMDIGNSPVAMTPFCQKYRNEATVPFRFWEHGFWVDHLRGKPYHISAIFLVDLRRFRAMLAGDSYRSTYANLALDPNSLANLDQDLPNYLQANIPIFSLPEQWLWCETWCSAKSKSKAKTIDLCNNPLTKMPKLDNAKMVIPGWEELDNKLQNMSDSLLGLH
ncbi:putative mitochondrial UDP-glucose:glycoprotein glucosyltransferase [Leptomonas pyrrhocoris]|uniref:Putative mitochondrial UDP-glucose:glycoprotein glucosyltransferase n=1 Tax=Leptomonas pyrrhocoris TaxID=157538 RepID=A0A0M9G241_LEPPY|nr:putative mitochondrial UDP-glucose:glycoprotein glucosyltransferase [Leptomonas pyrrhocoris]KPA80606.1 putative mitochondrial UDP-glucose:glycoprotein glucosyltransferase [Leptomonas pyrrhocoris]|eukprot:XP_015659045.1 putative mitochondrial UDP-glucose:glycoprotein glucosyltransferase [Leptomonas pyrrhocoris]